jgi:hypothetical protein
VIFPEVQHVDCEVLPGMTLNWSLPVWDFDLTGYTAAAVINGLEADISVTVTINELGAITQSVLSFTVANTITATWTTGGLYPYRVILTAPSPSTSTGVYCYGGLLVLEVRPLP